MMTKKKHEDLAGNDIKAGDYVAYAALWSRSATLKFGRVTSLVIGKMGYPETTIPKIQVVSVDRTWNDTWELQGVPWQEKSDGKYNFEKSKVQTLGFLDRMLVVDKSMVPAEARKLLDAAYKAKADAK